jgi:hypothetical protein
MRTYAFNSTYNVYTTVEFKLVFVTGVLTTNWIYTVEFKLVFVTGVLTTNWIYNVCHIFVLSGFKYSTIQYRFRHYKSKT